MMVLMMSLLHQVGKMYHALGMLFGADILILVSIYDPLPMNNAHRRFSAMTISCIVSVCRRRRRSHATNRHAARMLSVQRHKQRRLVICTEGVNYNIVAACRCQPLGTSGVVLPNARQVWFAVDANVIIKLHTGANACASIAVRRYCS